MQAYRPRCEVGQLRRLAVRSVTCLRADWTVASRPDRVVSWRFSDRCPRGVTRKNSKEAHLTCSNDRVLKHGLIWNSCTDYIAKVVGGWSSIILIEFPSNRTKCYIKPLLLLSGTVVMCVNSLTRESKVFLLNTF